MVFTHFTCSSIFSVQIGMTGIYHLWDLPGPEKEIVTKTVVPSYCPQFSPSRFGEPKPLLVILKVWHHGLHSHVGQGYSCFTYHLDSNATSQGFLNLFWTVLSPLSSMSWPLSQGLTTPSVESFFWCPVEFPLLVSYVCWLLPAVWLWGLVSSSP